MTRQTLRCCVTLQSSGDILKIREGSKCSQQLDIQYEDTSVRTLRFYSTVSTVLLDTIRRIKGTQILMKNLFFSFKYSQLTCLKKILH